MPSIDFSNENVHVTYHFPGCEGAGLTAANHVLHGHDYYVRAWNIGHAYSPALLDCSWRPRHTHWLA